MKNSTLTAIAIIFSTVSASSQSVTETRRIKTTALQIYETYKVVISGLYSNSAYTEDNFMALFDAEATIYNDIIPANTPAQLSPAKYFENFKANIKRIYPTFSDFRMGEPVSISNKWQIKFSFIRETRYKTQKEMNYPEWKFSYTITVEMDKWYHQINKVYENAKIVSVDVDHPLEKFFVIKNKENMPLTTKSGETLNGWDSEYNSRIFPEEEWNIKNIQISEPNNNKNIFEHSTGVLSNNQTDAHFYQPDFQKYPKNIWEIGVNYSPLALGYEIINGNKNIKPASDALSLSFFYGKQIFHKEKQTVFLNVGLDFNRYSHKFSGNDTMKYQNVSIVSLSVPLSVQYLYQLTEQTKKPIFLSCELGVFAEYTLSSRDKCMYDGIYYCIPSADLDGRILYSLFDFGILGGVGLWYALNNNNLLKFNVLYKHNLNLPWRDEGKTVKPENQRMRNIGFGISWVRTIEGKRKILFKSNSITN